MLQKTIMGNDGTPEIRGRKVRDFVFLGHALDDLSNLDIMGVMHTGEQVVLDLGVQATSELGGQTAVASKGVGLLHLVAAPVDGMILGGLGGEGLGAGGVGVLDGADDAIDLVVDDELEGEEEAGDAGGEAAEGPGDGGGEEEERGEEVEEGQGGAQPGFCPRAADDVGDLP